MRIPRGRWRAAPGARLVRILFAEIDSASSSRHSPESARRAPGAAPVKIHRSAPSGDFTIIPNETLRDERLSFAARGHLAYLLSRPEDWKTSSDDEAARARGLRMKRGEGREAMRRIYKELKDAGYMHLVRSADASGRWTTETHVFDRPCAEVRLSDAPESRTSVPPGTIPFPQVGPRYGKPGVGSPGVGSPDRRFTRTSSTKTEHEDEDQPQGQEQPQSPEQSLDKLANPAS